MRLSSVAEIKVKNKIRILICLKQIPDEREMATDPITGSLLRDNAGSIPNPADSAALELSVRLAEHLQKARADLSLTALTMGPKQARASLRQAQSLGYDCGIHLQDKAFAGSDVLATANTLAQAIEKVNGADLIFCGEKSADGDTGQLPAELSVWLKASYLPLVKKILALTDKEITVQVQIDDLEQIIKAKLPAVLQIKADAARLRPIPFRDRRKALSKPLIKFESADLKDSSWRGYEGSPTKVKEMFVPAKKRAVQLFEQTKAAAEFLRLKRDLIDNELEIRKAFEQNSQAKEQMKASQEQVKLSQEQPQGPLVLLLESSEKGLENGLSLLSKLSVFKEAEIDILLIKEEKKAFEPPDLLLKNADRLVIADSQEEILSPQAAALILADYLKERQAELCLLAATDFGRAVGPLAAALLKTGITADLTELSYLEGEWEQIRPAYGGKVLARIITPHLRPVFCTVRPKVWDIELKNNKKAKIYYLPGEDKAFYLPVKIISQAALAETIELAEAKRVLLIGGAISRAEELDRLIDYARENNLDWAVTRPLVQAFLAPPKRQVGISGLSLAADLALLVGVSGSIQTMSALEKVKTIIAVNNDPAAAVFQNADFGFVGDWREILQLEGKSSE